MNSLPALNRWLLAQASIWLCVLCGLPVALAVFGRQDWQFGAWGGLALLSYAVLWIVLGTGRRQADFVTLARFLGLLALAGVAWHQGSISWLVFVLSCVCVAADLLDGYLARRSGGSAAGAVLDMETDQFSTLFLAVVVHGCLGVGAWILLLPGIRYLYILVLRSAALPAHDPKPRDGDNRRARLICATVMMLLLTALLPPAPAWLRSAASLLAVVLLVYSFGSDTVFLLRRGRAARTTVR